MPSPKLLARFRVSIVVALRPERPPVRKPAGQSLTSSPTWPIALILAKHWPTILSIGQHACHGTAPQRAAWAAAVGLAASPRLFGCAGRGGAVRIADRVMWKEQTDRDQCQ